MTQNEILGYLSENWSRRIGATELKEKLDLDYSVVKRQLQALWKQKKVLKAHGGKYTIDFQTMVQYSKEGQEIAEWINRERALPPLQTPKRGEPDWKVILRGRVRYGKPRPVRYPPDWDEIISKEAPGYMGEIYTMRAVKLAIPEVRDTELALLEVALHPGPNY